MTKEEFEKYRKINNEITAIKKFLSFCGTKKYRIKDDLFYNVCPFSLRVFKFVKNVKIHLDYI